MEATHPCPQCGTFVPTTAQRCKECFHDFRAAPKSSQGISVMLPFLAVVALMSVMGAGAVAWMTSFPIHEKALVDGTTRQIQWVKEFKDGHLETDQVAFDQITKIEYRSQPGDFAVVAVLANGERRDIVHSLNQPMQNQTEQYAEILKKPLEILDAAAQKAP